MTAHALAQKAYSATSSTIRPPRAVEYEVIARVTHQLKTAAQNRKTDFAQLADALHQNNRLWTMLAANVADSENALPSKLRAQIFYLSEFSQRQAAQILAGSASVKPLLEVNTAILRGLRNSEAR